MPTAVPIKGVNDLATLFPDVAKEWHPQKDNGCHPSDYKPGSKHISWWVGSCGHEWQASIASGTKKGKSECPVYRTAGSSKKVWWVCPEGHGEEHNGSILIGRGKGR